MGDRLSALALAAVAGVLLWAAFPDVGFWPFTLVSMGLLWYALTRAKTAGWSALTGLVAGLVFFGPHLWWASVATALVPWVALVLLQAAFWAVLGLFWSWVRRIPWVRKTPWRQSLAFAVLFTGIEQWRSAIPFGGFPWGRLAWSVAGATPGRAAWLGGSVLVTFLLVWAASLVAITARDAYRARKRPGQYLPLEYAAPVTVPNRKPSRWQQLLRPELEFLPEVSTGVSTAASSPTSSVKPSRFKTITKGILVPKHLQPIATASSVNVSNIRQIKPPISPDLRLVIAALSALLLLAFPAWLPLAHDADAVTVDGREAALRETDGQSGTPVQYLGPPRSEWVNAGTSTAETGVLQVGIAQGNVFNPGLEANANADAVMRSHLEATQQLIDDRLARLVSSQAPVQANHEFDVIVWPENAAAWDPMRWPGIAAILDDYSARAAAPILIGSMEYPETGGRYNVMLLWDGQPIPGETEPSHGEVIARYAKQRPAPFGEYIPLRRFARMLTDQVDRLPVDMLAADNPPLINWFATRLGREVSMGVGICFEVAYDDIFIDAVRQGAEVIVVPTNNASFGVTAQSTQQLQMTQMQAITTGRAAIQISTVGVSGVFTPDGQLVARTNLWEQDRISALLPLRTSLTPAVRLGMFPAYLFQTLALALPAAGLFFSLRRNKHLVAQRQDNALLDFDNTVAI